MKTHTFVIKEADWPTSKYRTREWEKRVNIVKWTHDFVKGIYEIVIKIK